MPHIGRVFFLCIKVDKFVESPKTVMPDLRSLSRIAMRGHPELIETTGFRLQFIPYSMRGRNDKKGQFPAFYDFIKLDFTDKCNYNNYKIILLKFKE